MVTGHSPAGKAIFASDTEVESIELKALPDSSFVKLWGGDVVSQYPDDGAPPEAPKWFPPVGGFRFAMFTVSPQSRGAPATALPEHSAQELEEKLPGAIDHMEPDAPGMHTTDTIDFEYVISGRVVLELDDGATVEVGPGDTVVQNGTRHAWRNPFDEPCHVVVFLVGAERKG